LRVNIGTLETGRDFAQQLPHLAYAPAGGFGAFRAVQARQKASRK
jgi:hypothetical protein